MVHVLHALLLAGGAFAGYSLYKNASGGSAGAAPSAGPVAPVVAPAHSPSVSGYNVVGAGPVHSGVQHYMGHDRAHFQPLMVAGHVGAPLGVLQNPYQHHVGINAYRRHVGAFGHPNPHARGFIGRT